MAKCNAQTTVYSRIVGYYAPVSQQNKGMAEQYKNRKQYNVKLEEDHDKSTK